MLLLRNREGTWLTQEKRPLFNPGRMRDESTAEANIKRTKAPPERILKSRLPCNIRDSKRKWKAAAQLDEYLFLRRVLSRIKCLSDSTRMYPPDIKVSFFMRRGSSASYTYFLSNPSYFLIWIDPADPLYQTYAFTLTKKAILCSVLEGKKRL